MEKEKQCRSCKKTMPLSVFYKHKGMGDGHLNKCKKCTKERIAKHRSDNIEKVREYDRGRGSRQTSEYQREYRAKYPKKYKAHSLVNSHKKNGNLFEQPCEICGKTKVVAHHDDYDKPLNVRWLCQAHHKQWHAVHGEAKNPI